ncbi:hypothetical protein [Sphingobium sp.]|uniref:hypothetical protein n=1 Tax=Sphingobium sp. TaxID=1912891 RepID=UPI003B3AB7C3
MRNLLMLLTAASALIATPAVADETYVDATGGVIWNREGSNAVAAFTLGHDVELNDRFFVGVEGIAEKVLEKDTRVVWGIGGRVGAYVLPGSKLIAGVNWQSKDCRECASAVGLSTSWEQDLSEKIYGKVEYKHLLIGNGERDSDVVAVGLGFKF